MPILPPEKMGSFYLGAAYDMDSNEILDESINYDARDLTTHAVCVGMTGSGKTGLCIGLLEEAAIDQVPAIIIDPKGDMTNLLLQFEDLETKDFIPWINADDASRKNKSIEEFAEDTASMWKNGLADWGQDRERIQLLKKSVDYTIYTPGSDAGIPINIMGSFAAPEVNFDDDEEMLRERIQGVVGALLGMIDHHDDPSRSREGILLATLFEHHWRKNGDLDLTKIIMGIQKPPIQKLGVFDVDTFFPEKDRFQLAMEFNTLVASPQFSYWLEGDSLDIDKIYFTAEGKPRHSIFYIAHLSDQERMFFVTLLLNSVITWMRRQSGTTSLRSLLYFDEIFGFFPPTAQPPSKKPLLTLLKQARAFGVGTVLVTQNPVDIDYKGLSNAGTWFIGKLQTERDKARLLEGLEGALGDTKGSKAVDYGQLIASLDSRVFLLHNVHEDQPVVFHTRWVMSYLRGPLTRSQVKSLMQERKSKVESPATTKAQPVQSSTMSTSTQSPPSLAPGITQKFFGVWKSAVEAQRTLDTQDALKLEYRPKTLSLGRVRFYDSKRSIDTGKEIAFLTEAPDSFGRVDWTRGTELQQWKERLHDHPDHPDTVDVHFLDVPDNMNSAKELTQLEKEFSDWLYKNQRIEIKEHNELDLYQDPNESAEAFQMRIMQAAREARDEELDALQDKYEVKFDRINEKIRKEENQLAEQKAELQHRKTAEIVGVAETIFSVFIKKRRRSISAASSKSRMRRKAAERFESTQDDIQALQESYRELDQDLEEKMREIQSKWDRVTDGVTSHYVNPRRADVKMDGVFIVWVPYWVSPHGKELEALHS